MYRKTKTYLEEEEDSFIIGFGEATGTRTKPKKGLL
jgi:hypothetical protein